MRNGASPKARAAWFYPISNQVPPTDTPTAPTTDFAPPNAAVKLVLASAMAEPIGTRQSAASPFRLPGLRFVPAFTVAVIPSKKA